MESDFLFSPSYKNIKDFIVKIISSIQEEQQRENMDLLSELDNINKFIEDTPLSLEKGRYANLNSKIVFSNINKLEDIYLSNSFGNDRRLDYGTGHELTFLCFCYTQFCMGKLKINEIYSLFKKYWLVSRNFINKFNLEPAGSKGSWSLDDYQLLPFVFGSAEGGEFFFNLIKESRSVFKQKKTVNEYLLFYDKEVLSRSVITKSFIYGKYLIK